MPAPKAVRNKEISELFPQKKNMKYKYTADFKPI